MVIGSNGGQLHFSNAQFSQYRYVFDSPQLQTPIIYLTSSRQPRLCDKCPIHELEQFLCLCLSTNSSDTTHSGQNSPISTRFPSMTFLKLQSRIRPTFANFYLGDMSQQVTNLHHLGPVVVAQKVVGARKFSPRMLKKLSGSRVHSPYCHGNYMVE